MKKSLQKFIIYLIIGCIFCFIFYFLIKRYDFDGNTLNRIISNKYYLIFLFLSIIICLSIYGKSGNKTKFLIYFIVCINLLYLLFLFLIGNIGLNTTQGLIILGFLILGFAGIYIKNWFGYIIISISILGSLIILFLGCIPLFDEGPDFEGFEKNFNEKIFIYSDKDINEDHAQITKDNKTYIINNGLNTYDLKIGNNNSQIIFKSDTLYPNTYCFLVFKKGIFVEIQPQSAINVDKNFEIEILTGNIKYYPINQNSISFTGQILPILEDDKDIINIVDLWYNENLKIYIKGSEPKYLENKTLLNISKKTLNVLSKIFPGKYDKNLKNLQDYLNIYNIDLNTKFERNKEITTKGILENLRGGLKKGIEMVD